MRLLAATTAGGLLFAASFGLLVLADDATDLAAIAGGTGIVLAGALLGLTFLASWWLRGVRAYTVAGDVAPAGFADELVAAFDETTEGYDDAANASVGS